MKREEAEQLVTNVFQLTLELNRGKWNEDKEKDELIKFAKTFDEEVNKWIGKQEGGE